MGEDRFFNLPPHPLDLQIAETEMFQRREKIAHFLRGAELLRILQTGRVLEGEVLAGRIGVDRRTLRRYIAHLRELGFGIDSTRGANGRYEMGRGDTVPPMTFTDDELEVLILALSSVGYPGDELSERAGRLTQRINSLLPMQRYLELEASGKQRFVQTLRIWGAYNREQEAQEEES